MSFSLIYFFSWTKKVTKKSRTNECSAVCPAAAQGESVIKKLFIVGRGIVWDSAACYS